MSTLTAPHVEVDDLQMDTLLLAAPPPGGKAHSAVRIRRRSGLLIDIVTLNGLIVVMANRGLIESPNASGASGGGSSWRRTPAGERIAAYVRWQRKLNTE